MIALGAGFYAPNHQTINFHRIQLFRDSRPRYCPPPPEPNLNKPYGQHRHPANPDPSRRLKTFDYDEMLKRAAAEWHLQNAKLEASV